MTCFNTQKFEGQTHRAGPQGWQLRLRFSLTCWDTQTGVVSGCGRRTFTSFWTKDRALQPHRRPEPQPPGGQGAASRCNNCGLPLKKTKQPADALSELPVSELVRLLLSHYSEVQS